MERVKIQEKGATTSSDIFYKFRFLTLGVHGWQAMELQILKIKKCFQTIQNDLLNHELINFELLLFCIYFVGLVSVTRLNETARLLYNNIDFEKKYHLKSRKVGEF